MIQIPLGPAILNGSPGGAPYSDYSPEKVVWKGSFTGIVFSYDPTSPFFSITSINTIEALLLIDWGAGVLYLGDGGRYSAARDARGVQIPINAPVRLLVANPNCQIPGMLTFLQDGEDYIAPARRVAVSAGPVAVIGDNAQDDTQFKLPVLVAGNDENRIRRKILTDASGRVWVNVNGTVPISAGSLPLPAGAAVEDGGNLESIGDFGGAILRELRTISSLLARGFDIDRDDLTLDDTEPPFIGRDQDN